MNSYPIKKDFRRNNRTLSFFHCEFESNNHIPTVRNYDDNEERNKNSNINNRKIVDENIQAHHEYHSSIRHYGNVQNNSNNTVTTSINLGLIFIHGSCAASSQYFGLLQEIQSQLPSFIQYNRKCGQISTTSSTEFKYNIQCYLLDHLGCGDSVHDPYDWDAYSAKEQIEDLIAFSKYVMIIGEDTSSTDIVNSNRNHTNRFWFVIGHSYGASQAIQLVDSLNNGMDKSSRDAKMCNFESCESDHNPTTTISGLVLISASLKEGPGVSHLTLDGGHAIFTYLPLWLLKCIQPYLSKTFLDNAIHSSSRPKLQSKAMALSKRNHMAMCRAFYRQQRYASVSDAKKIKIPCIVIHGSDDKIFPSSVVEHLLDSLCNSSSTSAAIISDASHQVMEEKPIDVAFLILKFIHEHL